MSTQQPGGGTTAEEHADEGRPDLGLPAREPPDDRQPGPSGVALVFATVAMFAFVGLAVGLVAIGGWAATAGALAVMVAGVFTLSRYIQRIAWTRSSPRQLRRGLSGMNEDLSLTDEGHEALSLHDLPLENPARRELEERLEHERTRQPARS